MDKGVMEKYEQGITLFEEGRYEDAVACLIDAYESGYMQTEIILIIALLYRIVWNFKTIIMRRGLNGTVFNARIP